MYFRRNFRFHLLKTSQLDWRDGRNMLKPGICYKLYFRGWNNIRDKFSAINPQQKKGQIL